MSVVSLVKSVWNRRAKKVSASSNNFIVENRKLKPRVYSANNLALASNLIMQYSFQRILEKVLEGIRSWGEGISAQEFHPSYDRTQMEALFHPKTIAVIGASKRAESMGKKLYENLTLADYKGEIFPVNPKYEEINGKTCYDKVSDIDEFLDLAIIITPAKSVVQVIKDCGDAGVKTALILSTGFREIGQLGEDLEAEILLAARKGGVRIVGTNSTGFIRPHLNLFATFSSQRPKSGSIGFISQSGAMGEGILDWGKTQNVGFSAFVSVGGMIDISWGDMLHYLGDDPHTKAIVLYMETINYARSFISAAREVAYSKPIIVLKTSKKEFHDEDKALLPESIINFEVDENLLFDAVFRRSGMLRVETTAEIFFMLEVISKQPRPKGNKLAILTNANAPAHLATNILRKGRGELAKLSENTVETLSQVLPKSWNKHNPVDMMQAATPEMYQQATKLLLEDSQVDGLLVILSPLALSKPTQTAQLLTEIAQKKKKPILVSWMGGESVKEGRDLLAKAEIPHFDYPDAAAYIFNYMWQYAYNLKGIYQTPHLSAEMQQQTPEHLEAAKIIEQSRREDKKVLTQWEAMKVLKCYHLPVNKTKLATSEDQAWKLAKEIGKPVALKAHSNNILNKSEVGGVRLYLKEEETLRQAYRDIEQNIKTRVSEEEFLGVTVQEMGPGDGIEMLIGSKVDEQFGSIIFFGNGGASTLYYQDNAVALPPLNTTLARRAMEQTTIYKNLAKNQTLHEPTMKLLEQTMVRFSELIVAQPWIKEIYLNPVSVSREHGISILDATIVLYPKETLDTDLVRLAVRPYPSEYESSWTLKKSKKETLIRPIRPEDEPMMADFHSKLSPQSVYFRFFHAVSLDQRVSHDRLSRICFADYDRQITLVVETDNDDGERAIIGAIRIIKVHGTQEAEFGMTVMDNYQGEGIGTMLLKKAVDVCVSEGINLLTADILPENKGMRRICEKLGFESSFEPDEGIVKVSLYLDSIFDMEN